MVKVDLTETFVQRSSEVSHLGTFELVSGRRKQDHKKAEATVCPEYSRTTRAVAGVERGKEVLGAEALPSH